MPYYNVTPHTLYHSCFTTHYGYSGQGYTDDTNPVLKAAQWVEAEMTYTYWLLVQRWFKYMENDTAKNRYPDPNFKASDYGWLDLTLERVDLFIAEMDEDFQVERNRFQGKGAPDFNRLEPHAREAFVQESLRILLPLRRIKAEAERIIEHGATFPPPVEGYLLPELPF